MVQVDRDTEASGEQSVALLSLLIRDAVTCELLKNEYKACNICRDVLVKQHK